MTAAMILCAGFGTRLGTLTQNLPKPMLPVSGKPMLEYMIWHLVSLEIRDIVINIHYLAEIITGHFGDGGRWGARIQYSFEETPLGTAGAVKKVESTLEKFDNFLVLYGDVFSNQDYNSLVCYHGTKSDAFGTIVLHERNRSNSIVEMDGSNRITKFVERPGDDAARSQKWANSGLYCFDNGIFGYIPYKAFCDFPKEVFPRLVAERRLYGYPLDGYRCAVDSPQRYRTVQEDFSRGKIF